MPPGDAARWRTPVNRRRVLTAAVLLALLAAGAGGIALHSSRDDGPAPTQAGPDPATGSSDGARRRDPDDRTVEPPAPRPRAAAPDPGGAAPTRPTDPAAPPPATERPVAAEAPAEGGRAGAERLLTHRVVAAVPPAQVPEGMTELQPGEDPVIDDAGTPVGPGGGGPRRLPYWSRWKRVPPSGEATVRGRVFDAAGRGVEGAEVFRVRLDADGRRDSPTSFQWVTEIARTGPDGTFEALRQPEGRFVIAADWNAVQRRPRGLDLAASAPAALVADGDAAVVELRLPIDTSQRATVRGVVLDEKGAPKSNAQIDVPQRRERTGPDGRFALRGVAAGTLPITVSATGYLEQSVSVDLPAGAERDVEVRLQLAESGDLALVGKVVDETGEPVAGVPVFLNAGRGGSRWAASGPDGVFRFDALPRKYAATPVRVMVSPNPDADRVLPVGKPQATTVPAADLVLHVRRTAPLRVRLRDRLTGDPLPLFTLDVEYEQTSEAGPSWWRAQSMSRHEPTGEVVLFVPRGRVRLTVRAKDHRGVLVEADVPDAAEPSLLVLDLERE